METRRRNQEQNDAKRVQQEHENELRREVRVEQAKQNFDRILEEILSKKISVVRSPLGEETIERQTGDYEALHAYLSDPEHKQSLIETAVLSLEQKEQEGNTDRDIDQELADGIDAKLNGALEMDYDAWSRVVEHDPSGYYSEWIERMKGPLEKTIEQLISEEPSNITSKHRWLSNITPEEKRRILLDASLRRAKANDPEDSAKFEEYIREELGRDPDSVAGHVLWGPILYEGKKHGFER